jgi:hypothetical protein
MTPARLVRWYVIALGAGLLLEGALLLLVDWLQLPVGLGTTDTRHNVLHVVWGVALLVVVFVLARDGHEPRIAWAAVLFGMFYVALGVLGLTLDQPFGLQLGPGENAFHFVVGPLALGLGAWALRTAAWAPAVAPPAGTLAAPPAGPGHRRPAASTRRRSRRRGGSRRR